MGAAMRKKALMALGVLAAGYVAYPYVTLLRLGDAIRRGDATPLEALVEWDQVREGIKEDICDNVLPAPPVQQTAEDHQSGSLPPFGFSFVRGIAGNVIDKNVTPTALVSAAQHFNSGDSDRAEFERTRRAARQSPHRVGLLRQRHEFLCRAYAAWGCHRASAHPHSDGAYARPVESDPRLVAPAMLVQANART